MERSCQQESQSLSQNVKLGLQYRYQQGLVQVNHNRFMGYTKDEDGKLIIEPNEAEIVKRIYREYLEGKSFLQIGRGLEKDGILTGAGKQRWRPESVKKILTNEKYIGDALLQKTYTVDFLTKKRVSNNGIVPQYYVENSHPAIIPRDLYMQVQEEILRRANIHSGTERKKRVYSSRYALSSIVVCGHCGDIFRRIKWNNRGCKSTVWRCVSRVEKGDSDCPARTVKEETLQEVVVKAINEMVGEQDTFLPLLQANIEYALGGSSEEAIAAIDQKLVELQKELLQLANAKKDYEPIAVEIDRLREEKQSIMVDDAEREGTRQRVQEMMEYLREHSAEVTEYDEQLVRRLVEKITVFDKKFVVEFKAGISLDIRI